MVDEYIVREPRQVQALLHSVRLQILLAFDSPKTSAQVARELGEPPNRIGHHVRLLLQLGLLVVCYRRGRKVFLERKARNLKIPFSLTPYSDLEEAMRLASAEILQLLRQAVVYWRQPAACWVKTPSRSVPESCGKSGWCWMVGGRWNPA